MTVILALLLAISVNQDQAPLRAGCSIDSPVRAVLPSGTPLMLRYAVSGESTPCYKVSAVVDGKAIDGYLPAAVIEGLTSFDKSRREANWAEVRPALPSPPSASQSAQAQPGSQDQNTSLRIGSKSPLILKANELIEHGEPERAAALLEPELHDHPDAGLLTMAGLAAWRNEDSKLALDYWKQALGMGPDPDLQKLYDRVEKDTANDRSKEKLYGMRVLLRYDDVAVPVETARRMVEAVDNAYARVSAELGCTTQERIVTIVQSWETYRKSTGAAEWSAGMFDGKIHLPVEAGQKMTEDAEHRLAHETTHACLAMLGVWPTWLHEGMAQKLSGSSLSAAGRAHLADLAKDHKIPRLESLDRAWMDSDAANPQIAYALAEEAVDLLYEHYGNDGVRNVLKNPERLAAITADLDQKLGL